MGITVNTKKLEHVLDEAVAVAESDNPLPEEWTRRTVRMGECPSQTYVAALGVALLAKAADPRVDVLTVKRRVSERAYSMRGVAKVLAGRAEHYGYHLGVTGPEPLNNQPFFHGDRIDRFGNQGPDVQPFQREMVRWMRDLNDLNAEEARLGLAAYLRVRIGHAAQQRVLAEELRAEAAGASLGDIIELVDLFINEDPEGGRRGQALVAALLDCVGHERVQLAAINDPRAVDVLVWSENVTVLAVEVKQKPADEKVALHLADQARKCGADSALLVAIARDQEPLDRQSIRLQAQTQHRVLMLIVESVEELFSAAVVPARVRADEVAHVLPGVYLQRLQEHGASEGGQRYWADLCAGLSLN